MSLSVLEVLQNAEYNLTHEYTNFQKKLAIKQLQNAIKQLENDSDADKEFEEEDE